MTAIQTASSSRITSDDFRCRRSQFTVVPRYRQPAYRIAVPAPEGWTGHRGSTCNRRSGTLVFQARGAGLRAVRGRASIADARTLLPTKSLEASAAGDEGDHDIGRGAVGILLLHDVDGGRSRVGVPGGHLNLSERDASRAVIMNAARSMCGWTSPSCARSPIDRTQRWAVLRSIR